MSDEIPSEPTLAATVAQTSWGQYGATLTLPDGQEHVFAGADLDSIRTRVLEDARSYLASHVGHPGRLEVTDPDGTWLLGIPHDGGDLVAITSASFPALNEPEAVKAVSAGTARTVLLPPRPAIPTRRRSAGGRAQVGGHRSVSDRRLAVFALLAAVILALVLVEALDHHAPPSAAAKHARTTNQKAAAQPGRQPITVSKPTPAAKSVPKPRPVRHKPTTPTVARRHKTAAPKKHRAAQGVSHPRAAAPHQRTASGSAPVARSPASAPVETASPPVQAPVSFAPIHTTRTAPLPSPSGPPPL